MTKYVQRARDAGLGWPLPPEVDEARLEASLFPHSAPAVERYAAPDFAHLHQELKRKDVTWQLLWEEYATAHAGQTYRYALADLLNIGRGSPRVAGGGGRFLADCPASVPPGRC